MTPHPGRLKWRLFYLALAFALFVSAVIAQTPALTTVSDTVFRADGNFAAGTLLISWPAFATAGGSTIAAGNKSVTLGPDGALIVQLAPNISSIPAGTAYTVTYQLVDGTVKTESWAVGTTSPETIAQVRRLVGTSTPLTQACDPANM